MKLVVGTLVLISLTFAGGWVHLYLHVSLPAPVIGFALLALLVVTLERFGAAERFRETLQPSVKLLLNHMGLLFVPAGAGLLTQGAVLRQQWLPIIVGLVLSTLAGLVVTGWVTQKLARR